MANIETKNAIALFMSAGIVGDQEKQTRMRDFALRQDLTVVGFFSIEKNKILEGIRHALTLCSRNRATSLIMDELATFFLPPRELLEVLRTMESSGITIMFAQENFHLDHKTLNIIWRFLHLSQNALREQRSEKIKKSLKKKGAVVFGGRKFGAIASESYVIKQITHLREQGKSFQMICEMLENNHIKTAQNKKWHPTTVKRILERAQK